MRRLLLATTAALGGTLGGAGLATAQTTTTAPVPMTQFTAVAPTPGAIPSGYGAPFTAVPGTTPAPSTITVRLDGRINFYAVAGSDSGRNPGTVTTLNAAGVPTLTSTNTKLSDYSFENYIRLYPSFDGVAANGLQYGGFIEFRQDNAVAPGGGANGSISGATRSRGELYVRDDFVYLGTPQLGQIRLGSTWGADTLFITGTFENFDAGGWDGDISALFTGNQSLPFPFPDQSYTYTPDKIVYVSPQIAGFDAAVSFAPSSANVNSGPGNCSYANTTTTNVTGVPPATGPGTATALLGPLTGGGVSGCDAASSTSVLGETQRPRDLLAAELRYRGAFGPVGLVVEGGGIFSGHVKYDGGPVTPVPYHFDNMSIGDGGLQVTYGGFAVGGHITAGRSNGTSFQPEASNATDSFAWIAGSSYAVGPAIVGVQFFSLNAPGKKGGTGVAYNDNYHAYGAAAGGTYNFAPGMNIFLSYLYGHQHEVGTDLVSGVASSAAGHVFTHNNSQAQGFGIGTQFKW